MKNYNSKLESCFIVYFDYDNLYRWAVKQYLPTGIFQRVEEDKMIVYAEIIRNFKPDSQTGYIYESH